MATFLIIGQDLSRLESDWRASRALVNTVQLRESLTHLRNVMFDKLKQGRGITDTQTVKDFGAGFANGTPLDILPEDPAITQAFKKISILYGQYLSYPPGYPVTRRDHDKYLGLIDAIMILFWI